MAMDQYLLIPFLVGWTSIYQLFWFSPGDSMGFDTLPYRHLIVISHLCIFRAKEISTGNMYGDGRSISVGEVVMDDGKRWELQLKGARIWLDAQVLVLGTQIPHIHLCIYIYSYIYIYTHIYIYIHIYIFPNCQAGKSAHTVGVARGF